ncbi:hypothetical protein [Aquimarina sp. 2201CG5-10]|uniref:hypothetical protein n=1 Tax=Aquimarina callyspongiae TaxID=3098150 RepID=UPI002AB42AF0|nr:hypothetical protein [Aquimarina sp. 2201CG5-10]MDY8137811.1 hypothetical protein [Aquimarina sp. 2201CG5-10]
MKNSKKFSIPGMKLLSREQTRVITGGTGITQEQCEELGGDGVQCDWLGNRCRCRVIITPC